MEPAKALLSELFQYHNAVSLRFIAAFESHPEAPEKAFLLQSHILNSQNVWNSRLLGTPALYKPWDPQPVERFRALHGDNARQTDKILETFNIDDVVTWTNFKGISYTNSVADILLHVTNHNTYHRGQINQLFRSHNIEPLVADYIAWKNNL